LMYALLRDAGIASEPVLINTINEFHLDALPVNGAYNHTILYVPSLNKYIDPTGGQLPYEAKVWGNASRPVVRSDGLKAVLDRTPAVRPDDNTSKVKTRLSIYPDGTAALTADHEVTGISAVFAQEQLANYSPNFQASEITRVLAQSNWTGAGSFKHSPVNRDTLTQSIQWDVRIKNFLQDPEAGSISAHPGLAIYSHISQYMGNWSQENREFGSQCGAYRVQESFEVNFDPRYKVLRIPAPLVIKEPGIQFTSSLKLVDQKLVGEREIIFENETQECQPEEYARRQKLVDRILRHLRSPVLFMQ
jgi:hypothetical protein